jgi:hypothetical protein
MRTKAFFTGVIIAASIVTLYIIYRSGGLPGIGLYLAALSAIFIFFFLSQRSRAMLASNLAKLAKAINAPFDDNGALFNGEGQYCAVPVGFREINLRGWSSLDVYCSPAHVSGNFDGESVRPSQNTVLRQGRVFLDASAAGAFSKKEFSGNDILEILEDLRKAARVAETGTTPYKRSRAWKLMSG